MSFAMNRSGPGRGRSNQSQNLLSARPKLPQAGSQRLNHTAPRHTDAQYNITEPKSSFDVGRDVISQRADQATNVGGKHSPYLPETCSRPSIGRTKEDRIVSSVSNRGESDIRIGSNDDSNDVRVFRDLKVSAESGYGSRDGKGNDYSDSDGQTRGKPSKCFGSDSAHSTEMTQKTYRQTCAERLEKSSTNSLSRTDRMERSLQDSGYSTDAMNSLASSASYVEDSSGIADQLEDIDLSVDEQLSSGWWEADSHGATKSKGQLSDVIARSLEKALKSETPHILAKRIVYKKYLQSYIPCILSSKLKRPDSRVTIIDGFAGMGRATEAGWPKEIEHYETPIIALRVALHYFRKTGKEDVAFDCDRDFNIDAYLDGIEDLKLNTSGKLEIDPQDRHRVVLIFVEKNSDLFIELLKNVIKTIKMYRLIVNEETERFKDGICKILCDFKQTGRKDNEYLVACYVVHADFAKISTFPRNCVLVLNTQEDEQVPLDMLERSVNFKRQVFVSLNTEISPNHTPGNALSGATTGSYLTKADIDSYETLVRQNSRKDHFLSLEMQGYTSSITGHILFAASHKASYKHMKEAINSVKQNLETCLIACYTNFKSFKETNDLQFPRTVNVSDVAIANAVYQRFKDTSAQISEVESYILFETPFVFRKTPLKILEDQGLLYVTDESEKRKPGTFPDSRNWKLLFFR